MDINQQIREIKIKKLKVGDIIKCTLHECRMTIKNVYQEDKKVNCVWFSKNVYYYEVFLFDDLIFKI